MSGTDYNNDPSDTALNPAPKRMRTCITLGMPQTEVARRQRALEEKFENTLAEREAAYKLKCAAIRAEADSRVEAVSKARLAQDGANGCISGNARWQAYLTEDLADVAQNTRKAAGQMKIPAEQETQRLQQLWDERNTLLMERVRLQQQVEELESVKATELKKHESAEEELHLIKDLQKRAVAETERAQQVSLIDGRRAENGQKFLPYLPVLI